ncbi:response regulator [Chloroflexota bacterium]
MKSYDSSSRRTILVVEDEPNIVKLCRKTLTGGGLGVDIAVNGRVAQRMVEKNYYALCLIDIRTPEMNGIELFKWLGNRHPKMANRVIFTTGDIIGRETVHFIEQSGMPFLPKPFTPGELQTVVSSTLKQMKITDTEVRKYSDCRCSKATRFHPRVAGVLCHNEP